MKISILLRQTSFIKQSRTYVRSFTFFNRFPCNILILIKTSNYYFLNFILIIETINNIKSIINVIPKSIFNFFIYYLNPNFKKKQVLQGGQARKPEAYFCTLRIFDALSNTVRRRLFLKFIFEILIKLLTNILHH